MSALKIEIDPRQQRVLDAARDLIIHYGYDKTTIDDIAREASVSKRTIYVQFGSKDGLFERLLQREMFVYGQTWLDYIEADPRGGTIGGLYRAVLHAVTSNRLMSAMMRRDQRVFGSYLRKPNNIFSSLQASSLWVDTLRAMQAVGAVRQDIDPAVAAHIMDLFSFGMVGSDEFKDPDTSPPFEIVMETMADWMDQLLTPPDGGNPEAGKAIIRQLAETARQHFEQMEGD
jgi:AcrR family transcriptional regulator